MEMESASNSEPGSNSEANDGPGDTASPGCGKGNRRASISVKVAVNTIVPRSPFFFVFVPQNPDCYTHQKKRGRISPSMEWCYLCYLQLVSKAKNPLTPMAKEEVCPRDEIADPPGMAVLPIDIYGFDEGLVSFRTLCGVQSSLVRFAPNQAIDWGPLQWQAWLETLCLSSASS